MITLGIIGIIAAMTVPNLVNNYRKHTLETKLAATYSILSSAIKTAQADTGVSVEELLESCYSSTESDTAEAKSDCFVNTFFKPYLKLSGSCDYEDQDCEVKKVFTRKKAFKDKKGYKDLAGTTGNYGSLMGFDYSVVQLANGVFVKVYFGAFNEDNTPVQTPSIMVDLNGPAGPNQTGADFFFFRLIETNPSNYTQTRIADGLRCDENAYTHRPEDKKKLQCNTANDINGKACACVIQSNGWKFPKDYPIKKF